MRHMPQLATKTPSSQECKLVPPPRYNDAQLKSSARAIQIGSASRVLSYFCQRPMAKPLQTCLTRLTKASSKGTGCRSKPFVLICSKPFVLTHLLKVLNHKEKSEPRGLKHVTPTLKAKRAESKRLTVGQSHRIVPRALIRCTRTKAPMKSFC